MTFRSRRGRPKKALPGKDYGTPELQLKRRLGVTAEILDVLLRQGAINGAEHRAGLHFRWLYTLKYGACGPHVADIRGDGPATPRQDPPGWRSAREEEYNNAALLLTRHNSFSDVLAACVCEEPPPTPTALLRVQNGLNLLSENWGYGVSKICSAKCDVL